mmetsp:Transcript_32603/g.70423  ORF Transcript_32603/g.70423 Transcript_32603/m.70423 type:complete len:163 (-) Transcript_32603:22-510(-)
MMEAARAVADVRRAVGRYQEAFRRRSVDGMVALYDEGAIFSAACDDGGDVRAHFEALFDGAAHASWHLRTEPSESTVQVLDDDGDSTHVVFSGYAKVSKLGSFAITEIHSKFVFVYVYGGGGELAIKRHSAALQPKGRVHIRGPFTSLRQLIERKRRLKRGT